jgi:hypothetical protein
MTTAQIVIAAISSLPSPSAVTLQGGYALDVQNDRSVAFPTAVCHVRRRGARDRVCKMVALYPDKSAILFTWSETAGSEFKETHYPKLKK